jgi:hypothetical protein
VWAVITLAIRQDNKNNSLPIENVELPESGGGDPQGVAPFNSGAPSPKKEAVEDSKPELPTSPVDIAREQKIPDVMPDPLELPELQNIDPARFTVAAKETMDKLKGVSKDFRKSIFEGLGPSKGQGGSGEGGGKGEGIGKGTGPGNTDGTGKGRLTKRQERNLRWVMLFNTIDGQDYLRQLRGLGAILAIPDPQGGYILVRDLNHVPARGTKEDAAALKRIFWIDDKPGSVQSLAMALRLPLIPPHIVAFFPEKLEKELLDKELKYRGRREENIRETRFRVERTPAGSYVPRVESQVAN